MKSVQMNKIFATLALVTLGLGAPLVSAQQAGSLGSNSQDSSIYDTEIPSLEAVQAEFLFVKRHSKVRVAIDPAAEYDSWDCYYDCRRNGLTIRCPN